MRKLLSGRQYRMGCDPTISMECSERLSAEQTLGAMQEQLLAES